MRAIVLAEGRMESLGPLTLDIPTGALPIAGRPLVARTLDYLAQQGMTEAIVSCYRWPHAVERAMEMRTSHLPVTTAFSGPAAGGPSPIRHLAGQLDDRFVVMMGDVVTDLDLRAALRDHARWHALATVVVTEVASPGAYGEVAMDANGAVVMIDSGRLVRATRRRIANTGIYILEPAVLDYIPDDGSCDIGRDLLPQLVEAELPVYASCQTGFWRSLASHEQYRAANVAVLRREVRGMLPEGEEVQDGVWMAEGCSVDPEATIVPPVLVGRGCTVDRDAVIGPDTILGERVRVRRGAIVRSSVVLSGSKVGLATRLEDAVVRGNVLARAASAEPTYVDDHQVLETLEASHLHLVVKATVDRVLALAALIVLSPLMLAIALLIKLDSPGPIFYSQLRVGQGRHAPGGQYQGRVFELMKFRTMSRDADRRLAEVLVNNQYGSAPFVKIKDDPRITRLGHFLRASSLDELPQLLNVVKGDMGLVGNRPLPLYEAEQLDDDWQRIRFDAPAGITGLWQISGRSDLSAEERMVLDNYYALTRSLWSDIRILLATIPVLVSRRGAS